MNEEYKNINAINASFLKACSFGHYQGWKYLKEPHYSSDAMDFGTAVHCALLEPEKFKEKYDLPFTLLSDSEEALCIACGVLVEKNMYGKQVRGVERSTFLFDSSGKLVKEWRGLKVPGHVTEVLQAAQAAN